MSHDDQNDKLGAVILPFVRLGKMQPTSTKRPEPEVTLPVHAMIDFIGGVNEYLEKFVIMHDDVTRLFDLLEANGVVIENGDSQRRITARSKAIVAKQVAGLKKVIEQLVLLE